MNNSLNMWKRLYDLSDQLQKLKPWEHMWSSDYVCIEIAPDAYVYCVIMGRNNECMGVSMYEGEDGYADLISIDNSYDDSEVLKYIMYEQNCLTWYLGNRDEVPPEQIKIIKELGLTYHGKNAWPFFISYEKQYSPCGFNDYDVKRFVIVLERLLEVLKEYVDNQIDVNFDRNEMIFAHEENKEWVYEAMSLPEGIDKFDPVELSDVSVYKELTKQNKTSEEFYIDLLYVNSSIKDENYKKPINVLLLLVVDAKTHMISHVELLKPDNDEISAILNYIIPYILENGIPNKIYIRNPTVFVAIDSIATYCSIKLDMDDFLVVDDIFADMCAMME